MIVLEMLRTHEHVDTVETTFRLTDKGLFYLKPRDANLWMPICSSSPDGLAFTFSRGHMRPSEIFCGRCHETDDAIWETELPILQVRLGHHPSLINLTDYGFCYQGRVLPRWKTQAEEHLAIGTHFTFRQDSTSPGKVTHLFAHERGPFWKNPPVATLRPWWEELFERLGRAKVINFKSPNFAATAA